MNRTKSGCHSDIRKKMCWRSDTPRKAEEGICLNVVASKEQFHTWITKIKTALGILGMLFRYFPISLFFFIILFYFIFVSNFHQELQQIYSQTQKAKILFSSCWNSLSFSFLCLPLPLRIPEKKPLILVDKMNLSFRPPKATKKKQTNKKRNRRSFLFMGLVSVCRFE